jgi:polyhydroxyalkanoate synthase
MLARVTGGIATIGDIVPGEQGHSCQVNTKVADAPYVGPDEWLKAAPRIEGSWWPE